MIEKENYLQEVVKNYQRSVAHMREILANTPTRDNDGGFTRSLASDLKVLSIACYCLEKNKQNFCERLNESVQLIIHLFERGFKGEAITESYLTIEAFENIFDGLASGNISLAKKFAEKLIARDKLLDKNVHSFSLAFGNTLIALVLENKFATEVWLKKLKLVCKYEKNFRGYPTLIDGILNKNLLAITGGLKQIVTDHVEEVEHGEVFTGVDEYLCIWGLGLANFSRYQGLQVESNSQLIPKGLLL